MTTYSQPHSNLKRLRKFLTLTQKEMADLGGCSRHTVQSIEIGRVVLSARIASKISTSTGIDLAWLMSNDRAPMITSASEEYTISEFQRRQTNRVAPDAAHYKWRELQLAGAFDMMHRLLAANRLKGKDAVNEFMDRVENSLKAELKRLPRLEDRILGERRRAKEAALRTGRIMALHFLTPFDMKPLLRGRERLGQAVAAFTSRQTRQARRQTRRVKSDK
jgi:transcriptional regulator with XRE-family HTH domain